MKEEKAAPRSGLVCIICGNYCPAACNLFMSYRTLSPWSLSTNFWSQKRLKIRVQDPVEQQAHQPQKGKQSKLHCKDLGSSVSFRYKAITCANNIQALEADACPNTYSTCPAINFNSCKRTQHSMGITGIQGEPNPYHCMVVSRWVFLTLSKTLSLPQVQVAVIAPRYPTSLQHPRLLINMLSCSNGLRRLCYFV